MEARERLNGFATMVKAWFSHRFWSDWRTITVLYTLLPLIVAVQKWTKDHDTYQIYKSVFVNTLQQLPLYDFYPYLHGDCNHYGPVFFYVIAPFASLPDDWGVLLWLLFLVAVFYVAVRYLPLERWQKVFMFWFCAHEVLTPLFVEQFDLAMAACYLLIFACVEKKQPVWAAFFIILTMFIKLYGVMGFAFFFFIEDKKKFILACLGWAALFFVAPMLISSPEYVIGQYQEWFAALTSKNDLNQTSIAQNISLLGMVHRITGLQFSDLWLILPGMLLFAIPYLRLSQYKNMAFRQTLLASVLMFVVLFSTGSESSGYIIPFVGVVIWYTAAPWQRNGWDIALLVFAFILTSLSPSDLFPAYIRKEWVQPYALKALPITLIWFKLCYEMYTKDYAAANRIR
jgi:hypothetical protein